MPQEDKRADETPAPAHAALADEADVEPAAEVSEPVRTYAEPPPEPIPARRPAEPAAVRDAIEDVNRIVALLKEALEDMEDVLETIEVAERQKTADEREIESLQRALGRLHRPRDRGHHSQ